jgi:sugar lactone lactonase YvrE
MIVVKLVKSIMIQVDGSGNLYIADMANNAIRKVTAATGIMTTVAGSGGNQGGYSGDGGPASNALVNAPQGIAVDGSGNLYVADSGNDSIRMLVPASRALLGDQDT